MYSPVYSSGDDTSSERTFESLNGDLGKSNFSTAANSLTAECFKVGTFARGYFYGFNFPDRYHESQFDQDPVKLANDDNRSPKRYFVASYSLSANIFVPYPSITYISYQGFFCAEAIKKKSTIREGIDSVHKYKGNRFVHHLYVDDQLLPSMVSSAPSSKSFANGPNSSPNEFRWRWQNRTKCVFLDKGYHNIDLYVQGLLPIRSDLDGRTDATADKLQHRCASMTVLAMKAPNYSSPSSTPTWQWFSINNSSEATLGLDSDGLTVIVPPEAFEFLDDIVPPAEVTPIDPDVSLGTGPGVAEEDSPWPPPPETFTDPDAPIEWIDVDIDLSFLTD